MSRLKEFYDKEVVEGMTKKFNYKNVMAVPKLSKIVINMGVGEAKDNAKVLDGAVKDLTIISGQKPIITKAKKSVAAFKLINIALPRVRDFRGVKANSFDGRGNYTMGIKEQLIFPEIEYDKVDKIRGMDIIFVTTAETDEEGRELLRLFGMPFEK